jgi:hypothetical protein
MSLGFQARRELTIIGLPLCFWTCSKEKTELTSLLLDIDLQLY